ncbi:hypothetical protein SERLA73DRAFT_180036 [Serpula lacrymans var. lacrymans S7.3]|uniref:Uncharacterized protein n=2 Tax=Serpula lacrymans var. lacrymans TaxID=341189 RepID=F8PVJ7_SERL3|nr:uncharacterized protein SERLADRAFT_465455 [Serpula lacrymans var. lacrymans S7.9]EGN99814.1 hypothetical protein SERLA73DRAFT_180036 [Serpula lacrymans var. lacrymans S7.3]EGO25384.1 hypothetical protein SERLADRAFT_465455 [Serpula lacrymans var. lacrymans S7.9]
MGRHGSGVEINRAIDMEELIISHQRRDGRRRGTPSRYGVRINEGGGAQGHGRDRQVICEYNRYYLSVGAYAFGAGSW